MPKLLLYVCPKLYCVLYKMPATTEHAASFRSASTEDYLKAIRDAGFSKVELLSDRTYVASHADGDPITGGAADVLLVPVGGEDTGPRAAGA